MTALFSYNNGSEGAMRQYKVMAEPDNGEHLLIVASDRPQQPLTWGQLGQLLKNNQLYQVLLDQNRGAFESSTYQDVYVGLRHLEDAKVLLTILNDLDAE
ncbi:hypothetical protein IV73_GL001045 [Weissella kandleri]|uniref:Uncharacterized protein n=2 Tax=Weissella kandleri TaxID=1616 RepID=A0A0R2JC88_9LACO|nr:hypothetical protein IV73_GL001045 [Weissella kandleri]